MRQGANIMDTYNAEQLFFDQAKKIHDTHYDMKISKDEEIARRRIDKFLAGEINLQMYSVIKEINKLDELERYRYIQKVFTCIQEQRERHYTHIINELNTALLKSSKKINISSFGLFTSSILLILLSLKCLGVY